MKPLNAFFALACVLSIPFDLDAQTITATPNTNFVTSGAGRDIALSIAMPSWALDLSTDSGANMDLFAIVGNDGGTGGTSDLGYYTSDVGSTGLTGNQLLVGPSANVRVGTFVWKFVLAPGQTTTGGTITADVGFRGTPSSLNSLQFIGVNETFTPSAGPAYSNYNYADYAKVSLTSTSSVYGTYTENGLTLAVPVGVSEFFVVLSDVGYSGRYGLNSLSVEVTAVPEPTTVGLIAVGLAGIGLIRRRRVCR